MKLIANNGEVLAEWTPQGTKRNLYCAGGFGLMLTKRALARCIRADGTQTYDIFKAHDPAQDHVESGADPEQEEKKEDRSFWGLIYG